MERSSDLHRRKDAEAALLGALLRDNANVADVAPALAAEDFAYAAHATVYAAVLELWREGKPADLVTVGARLFDTGGVADATPDFLARLWEAGEIPSHARQYAGLVREASLYRRLDCTLAELREMVRSDFGRSQEHLLECERRIFDLAHRGVSRPTRRLGAVMQELYERQEAIERGEFHNGLSTGFPDLDRYVRLRPRDLMVVGARPSAGKTALACALMLHVAVTEGVPVYFASMEQGALEIGERLVCQRARINSHRLRMGRLLPAERDRYLDASSALASAPLIIDDSPRQDVFRILSNARRHKLRDGIGLLVVDYLQYVAPEDRREPRESQVATIARRFKEMARELDLPVIALAQLNRESEKRPDARPKLSDLRESGGIEADADVAILLHKTAQPNSPVDQLDLLVEKHRNGPTGEVTLLYRREFMAFENAAPSYP